MRKEFGVRFSNYGSWWYGSHWNSESERFESLQMSPSYADRFTRSEAQQIADGLNESGERYEWSVVVVTR